MIMRTASSADKFIVKIVAEIPEQDLIEAELTPKGWRLRALGCCRFLDLVRSLAATGPDPRTWPLPEERDHAGLLLREFILKARGEWEYPYADDEICHCRKVSTATVDRAILNGARTGPQVSRLTTASTSCGTCRPQVERLIAYRESATGTCHKKTA